MEVAVARSYDARLVDRRLVRGKEGRSAFTLYRLDIEGKSHRVDCFLKRAKVLKKEFHA